MYKRQLGEKIPSSELERELNNLLSKVKVSRVGLDKIKDSVKMYLAIKKIAFENNYDAVAFSCWPKLMPLKMCIRDSYCTSYY